MCAMISPEGEGGVRGKGLPGRLRLSFQPLAPVLIPAAKSFRRGNSLVRLKCEPRVFHALQFWPSCVGECVGFFALFGRMSGRDGKSTSPFPLTPALSLRERENHSAPQEEPSAPTGAVVQVLVGLSCAECRCGGSQLNFSIPRMLTKRSRVLPLPEGEGGVRGKGLPGRLRLSFQPLAPVLIPAAKSFRRGNSLVPLKCKPRIFHALRLVSGLLVAVIKCSLASSGLPSAAHASKSRQR